MPKRDLSPVELDRLVTTRTTVELAYQLVANVRERHHADGDMLIDTAALDDMARTLYHWQKRLWEATR